jgi:hypothetical protein
VPVAGIPLIVPVPSWLSAKATIFGSEPVLLKVGVGFPVAVTVNVPLALTVKVVLVPLVIAEGEFTVTVVCAAAVAGVLAVLVTVSV